VNRGRVEEDTTTAVGGPQGYRGHLRAGAGTVGRLRAEATATRPATGGQRWGGERRNHEIEAKSLERFPFVHRGLAVIVRIGLSFCGVDAVARREAGDRRGRQTEEATDAGTQ